MDDCNQRFWIGCAVWAHPGWRGGFYPSRPVREPLRLYSQRLTAVEGNSFFYARPGAPQLERWHAATPAGFRFCPKLPAAISHAPAGLEAGVDEARRFLDSLAPLEGRLGPCFLQLPPTYGPALAQDLEGFLRAWPRDVASLTVELRNRNWYTRQGAGLAESILTEQGMGRAVLDPRPLYRGAGEDPQRDHPRRKPDLPAHFSDTGPEVVLRLVAHPRREPSEPYLDEWAQRIHAYLDAGRRVYAFLHCPDEDHSPGYAMELQRRLVERGAPVPPLLEPQHDPDGQLELF